jgi:integrase
MPDRAWRWNEQASAYVEERRGRGEWSESTVLAYRGHLRAVLPLLTLPDREPPTVDQVSAANVRNLRECGKSPNYVGLLLVVLRRFLAWAGNPISSDKYLWRIERQDLGRRRWLQPAQIAKLWNAATPRERVAIGLMLWAGLRRIEVLRLRVKDAYFALDGATLSVCGKSHKWRTVPMPSILWAVLKSATEGKGPEERFVPGGKNMVDRVLYAAGKRSGAFPSRPNGTPDLSNHDLRRTYIRQLYSTGKVDLATIAASVGHASINMTTHYAGLNRSALIAAADAMTAALGVRT